MKRLAIVYHSGHGHTRQLAYHVAEGARNAPDTEVRILEATEVMTAPDQLAEYDGFAFGSPTYLGGVSGPLKSFMDSTGRLWRRQGLRGRVAAGFTVSSLPAGDKQSTLLSLFVFSMQHGMLWVGNPFLPEQHDGVAYDEAVNRLGSWSGLMAQSGHGAPADSFVPGDVRNALLFGEHFAATVHRLCGKDSTEPTELRRAS